MSLFISLLNEDAMEAEVPFDSSSDAADTELANDAIEVQEAVNEAGEVADSVDDGVEIVEAAESLIVFGQIAAAGQPVCRGGLYVAESRYEQIKKTAGSVFASVEAITNGTDFESVASSESSLRARAVVYAQEGFVQEATALVKRVAAWIANLFEKIVVVIKKLFMSAAKVKKQLEDLKSSLGKTEEYLDSSDKDVKVAAQWLSDGSKIAPSKAVASALDGYGKMSSNVTKLTQDIKGKFAEIAKAQGDSATEYAAIISGVEVLRSSSAKQIGTMAGRPVGMSNGRVVVGSAPAISKKTMPAMGRSDLVKFVGEAIELASALEKHKDHIKDAEKAKTEEVKLINEAAAKLDKDSTDAADSAKTAELRRRITALTKVSVSKDIASLNAVSSVAFGVLFAAKNLAQANATALAKKKSS